MQALLYPARRAQRGVVAVVLAFTLSACGGWWDDDAPTAEISGVAATGAAIANAEVKVVNAHGESVTARTGSDGRYSVLIADAAPFMLSVVDAAGKTWYSYAAAAGTAHITPLTTLALLDANDNKPLADLMSTWRSAKLGEAQVLEGAKTVNANLRALMNGQGVDATAVNIFNTSHFSANRSGLDAVLDAMRVTLSCNAGSCTQSITSPTGSVLVNWNGHIATTGITLSWAASSAGSAAGATAGGSGSTGTAAGSSSGSITVGLGSCKAAVAGTWSMVVQTTLSMGAAVPEICIDGLPGAPSSQAEFCSSDTMKGQLPPGVDILSCAFAGNTGTISARISSPIVIDYTIKYIFVKR